VPSKIFTLKSNGILERIVLPVLVRNPLTGMTETARGLLDTGCNTTSLTRGLAWKLNLPRQGDGISHTTGGKRPALLYRATIILPDDAQNSGGIEFAKLRVGDFPGAEAFVLIGMDIITQCDLAITERAGNTIGSYRRPHTPQSIDFHTWGACRRDLIPLRTMVADCSLMLSTRWMSPSACVFIPTSRAIPGSRPPFPQCPRR
jgi:hypothetical protein